MSLERIFNPNTRWGVAFPEAFADWQNPTAAELNANQANDPTGLVFHITCAVNQDGSNFDLGDSDTDDSLTFCQVAGAKNPTDLNPDIQFEVERSKDRKAKNAATTAFNLFAWKGVEYFVFMSVGEEPGTEFKVGDRVKMARVATDFGVDAFGTGENIRLQSQLANRGDVNWNYEIKE